MKWTVAVPVAVLALAACSDGAHGPLGLAPGRPLNDEVALKPSASIDAVTKVMALNVGGTSGATQLKVIPTNGDGKQGCNLTGDKTLVVSISSSNTAVATVSPASITFTSCGDEPTLTVTPVGQGSATIGLAQSSNNTGASFDLSPATFTANVAPAGNTAPSITVTGVTHGGSYEIGTVPAAVCSVADAEDGNSTFAAALGPIAGTLAEYGLGSQEASCSYADAGGLMAAASATYTIVDTTAPEIAFVSRTAANSNGWNNGDVTVVWTCTDSGSGVVSASVSVVISAEGADQSATGTCSDRAGNVASDTQGGINVDKTAPTLSPSVAPNPVLLNGSATASPNASDALSGVGSAGCAAVNTSSVGSHSVLCTVTDNAGNAASASTSYGVAYAKTGYLDPIPADADHLSRAFKAGSTLPVKFQLRDANGAFVRTAAARISITKVSSTTGGDVAESISGTADGTGTFRYSMDGEQYIYNLGTAKSQTGTFRIIATLDDGTTIAQRVVLK